MTDIRSNFLCLPVIRGESGYVAVVSGHERFISSLKLLESIYHSTSALTKRIFTIPYCNAHLSLSLYLLLYLCTNLSLLFSLSFRPSSLPFIRAHSPIPSASLPLFPLSPQFLDEDKQHGQRIRLPLT